MSTNNSLFKIKHGAEILGGNVDIATDAGSGKTRTINIGNTTDTTGLYTDVNVNGDLIVKGTISASGVSAAGNYKPSADNTYIIGDQASRWLSVFASSYLGHNINIKNASFVDTFSVDGNTGNITTSGDITVNGGDITTSSLSFNIGTSQTGNTTTNINTINTSNTYTKTMNIGTGGVAGSITNINIGSSAGTSSINAQGNMTVTGNLTVNGELTTVTATEIKVDDINIELGAIAAPTDSTANTGGITLKGATDKTLTWLSSNNSWNSSENFNIVTGKTYKINSVDILSSTTLGSSVVNSSLTSVGTVGTGTWNATTISTGKGGTGLTTFTSGGAVYATSSSVLTTGTLPVASGGTGVTSSTGTGNVVLSTSPTLVTPVLGTPTSGNLTNCTFPTLNQSTTGNAATATKLNNTRTFTLTGDVTGTVDSDLTSGFSIATTIAANSVTLGTDTTGNYVSNITGGTGISITGTAGEGWSPTVSLTDVGTAGTYRSVTTNAQGRVTGGTNPTTLAGYGITDASLSDHTHNYAGSSSVGGAATSVANSLVLKFDTGTTEGTNLYTFNGSSAKTINIKAGANVSLTNTAGVITISSTDTNTVYSHPTQTDITIGTTTNSVIGTLSVNTYGHVTDVTTRNLSLSDLGYTGASNANYFTYSHPTGDGNLHVPATGTTNSGKFLMAGTPAGNLSWGSETSHGNILLGTNTITNNTIDTNLDITGNGTGVANIDGTSTKALTVAQNGLSGGTGITFTSSVVTGQSTYILGTTDKSTVNLHTTSTLSVNYATYAGTADALTSANSYSVTNLTVSGTLTETSDRRLKTNIQPIRNATDKVQQLNGCTFNKNGSDARLTGVIAQDVQKVLPEAIITDENGYLSVAYGNLVGLLIESIKELKNEIEELKGKK